MTLFSRTTKANIFALFVTVNMILYYIWGGLIPAVFGQNTLLTLIMSQIAAFIFPMAVYFILTKDNIKDILKIKPISIFNVLVIICISIFIQPLLMTISTVSSYLFGNTTTDYIASLKSMPQYMIILTSAVFPAIMEEAIYRGIIFSNLRNKSQIKACIFTGLLFGMIHLNGEQFFYAFFMGSILSYFVYKTGSIFSSILSHFTINFSQTMLTLYYLNAPSAAAEASQSGPFLETLRASISLTILTVLPLIFLFGIFEYINRKRNTETNDVVIENEEIVDYAFDSKEKLISPFFIINFIIFLYFVFFVNI